MKHLKNNFKTVFLAIALMASVLGYANNDVFKIVNTPKKTILTLDVKQGNQFTIKDINGVTLYKETIAQSGVFQKGFDLTTLPDGNYFFELDKDMEIKTIAFKVTENVVTYDAQNVETIFKPATRVKDDIIYVNRLALDKSPLEISIYYIGNRGFNANELIYSESITTQKDNIRKVYKIEDYTKGDIKIVYKTEGKTFVEFI